MTNLKIDIDGTTSDHAWITLNVTPVQASVKRNARKRIRLDPSRLQDLNSLMRGDLAQEAQSLMWPDVSIEDVDNKVATITSALVSGPGRIFRNSKAYTNLPWWTQF